MRAPRAVVMRRREALALLLVLPLAMDPVHLLIEMQVLQGVKIKRIGRRTRTKRRGKGTMTRGRRMSSLPLHQRTLRRNIQGKNLKGELGSLDRQLVCQIPKGCKPFYIVKFEIFIQIFLLRPKVTPNEYKPCFQNKNIVRCSCDTQWISKTFASHNSSQHCRSQKTKYTMSQTSLHFYG